jgi:L,D-peptidoglycan transpeptidase YkuD (ErfK/YbiS/YcfS/YnhG family)
VTRRSTVLALTFALLLAAVVGGNVRPAAAATIAYQVLTVNVPTATSTYATVEAWNRQADGRYKRVAFFASARIGAQGVGATNESLSRTPAGRFRLTQPFGIKANPGGMQMPYHRVDRNDIWTGSTGTVINEHRRCAPGTCPAHYGRFERLSLFPGAYDYAVFIGYNAPVPFGTGAVRGAGSAFFLHVKNGSATGGCVAVTAAQMVWILRWLRSTANPIISIGVGATAYAPIPNRYA